MTVSAARALAGAITCFVGIGLPSTAANLARRTHSPDLVLIYESGALGAKPGHLPASIGDGVLAETADAVVGVAEVFNYWLQPGRIGVGFLGAAQLDRSGAINTTVVGDYHAPGVRLPGAGGAPEIASGCREVFVVLRHTPRALVERVDFVTTRGRGPSLVITDLGELRPEGGELVLTALHPGVDLARAKAMTGWELRVAPDLAVTPAPTGDELSALRALKAATG
ncbi:CoA-transferase subunit beta [Actinokineospora guangxiensis]|uniref:CoA-transferase subunit beta n=1 Tax=Actinokineospora guangxiensis TaxID=1490288 RepID=A0ABW0ELD1_9PSEU